MPPVRVAVYGASLMMAVLEASLRTAPELAVIRLDPATPEAGARLDHFAPQIIIIDQQVVRPALATAILLWIDQHANNQAAWVNCKCYPIQQRTQLLALLQQLPSQQDQAADRAGKRGAQPGMVEDTVMGGKLA